MQKNIFIAGIRTVDEKPFFFRPVGFDVCDMHGVHLFEIV